jgi:hypothetical protein
MSDVHNFYSPLARSRAFNRRRDQSAAWDLPNKDLVPHLAELPDNELVRLTYRQLAALSTVSVGSMSFRLQSDTLLPAVEGSNVYRVGDVRAFCERHAALTAERLDQAARALGKIAKRNQR